MFIHFFLSILNISHLDGYLDEAVWTHFQSFDILFPKGIKSKRTDLYILHQQIDILFGDLNDIEYFGVDVKSQWLNFRNW